MPKKAYLVDYSIRTRVVVDVPKDKIDNTPRSDDELFGLIASEARDHILRNGAAQYLCPDNVMEIHDDYECPAGALTCDPK